MQSYYYTECKRPNTTQDEVSLNSLQIEAAVQVMYMYIMY